MNDGKFYDVSSQPGGKYNERQGSSFTLSLSRNGRLPKSLKVGEADGCYHHLSLTRSKNEDTIKKRKEKKKARRIQKKYAKRREPKSKKQMSNF